MGSTPRRKRARTTAAAVAVTAAAALALAGCRDGGTSSAGPASHSGKPPAASHGAGGSSGGGGEKSGSGHGATAPAGGGSGTRSSSHRPAPGPTKRPAPPGTETAPRCSAGALRLSVGRPDVGAGNFHYPLVLTNIGGRDCSLHGFPGVSARDASGAQLGKPAVRTGGSGSAVVIPPRHAVTFDVHTVNEGLIDKPCEPRATSFLVYPPGSYGSLTVPAKGFRECGGVFEVTAVQ